MLLRVLVERTRLIRRIKIFETVRGVRARWLAMRFVTQLRALHYSNMRCVSTIRMCQHARLNRTHIRIFSAELLRVFSMRDENFPEESGALLTL